MEPDPGIDIDSNCYAAPIDADGPVEDTCGNDATTYIFLQNGVRRYVCPEHAEQVDRFDETDEPHPHAVACERCRKLTPVADVDRDRVCTECRR